MWSNEEKTLFVKHSLNVWWEGGHDRHFFNSLLLEVLESLNIFYQNAAFRTDCYMYFMPSEEVEAYIPGLAWAAKPEYPQKEYAVINNEMRNWTASEEE